MEASYLEDQIWRLWLNTSQSNFSCLLSVLMVPDYKDLPCRFSSHSNLVNYLSALESVLGLIAFIVMSSFKSLPTLPNSNGENPDHQSLEDYISYP